MSTTFIFKTITPHHSEDWPLLRIVTYQIAASLPEFEQVLLWEIPWELTDEMRRRVWATVRMSDIFMSQHVALPAMIHDQDCDTELPSNVFDEDFGPETEIMPPPRPSTEPTPIAYALAKCRLGLELGNIIQVTGRVGRQVHYEEILRFDARLQGIMEELPPHLKMTPLEGSQDPVSLLMARFSIDILYQKILQFTFV
ncbi:Trichosetin biosynthesis cluster transcription factor TF23 like protein [Verticillium longisporum]|nr:Trichosetin biosynthesis cluster transcription factor TF23 like protein [Verticillium longisporum]